MSKQGALFLSIPSAFTETTGKKHWHILLKARAIENFCYIFAPAQSGKHFNGRRTYGHSIIISPDGKTIKELKKKEGIISANIDPSFSKILRKKIPDPPKFIFIKPDIILHERCVFFDTNAARSKFKNDTYLNLRSSSAFKSMFAKKVYRHEDDMYPTERTAVTADNITTDIQAEIIAQRVSPKYFIEIV